MYVGMIVTVSTAVFAYICCQLFGIEMARMFSKDSEVISSAAEYLKTYSLDCVMLGFVFAFNGFFIGYGKANFTMFHSIVTSLVVRIPLVYYLCLIAHKSLYVIGFASPISTGVSLIICIIYWKISKIDNILVEIW